jgi:hypothetical protein
MARLELPPAVELRLAATGEGGVLTAVKLRPTSVERALSHRSPSTTSPTSASAPASPRDQSEKKKAMGMGGHLPS